ncbi:hypothetical protein JW905_07145 [bacterium]|nr:hypothetical protein [candidate division CSSED10-310 bacterium]
MDLNTICGICSFLIGCMGFSFAVMTNRENKRLKRERFRFSWHDVYQGTKELSKTAVKKFKPDIMIVTPGGPSIVANLLLEHQQYFVRQVCLSIGSPFIKDHNLDNNQLVETVNYHVWLPNSLCEETQKDTRKILIVDDALFTGELVLAIRDSLIKTGYLESNIEICSLIAMSTVMRSTIAPKWVHFEVTSSDFFLPWGKV